MADAIAISAAVVQFLDIAIKLALQLSSLYKEVRDVPEKLQRLKVDLDQQIAIAKYVESSHASFWNAPPAASAVSISLDQPLADYVAVMEQLIDTVQSIMKPEAGIIRRSWNALRATQKCIEAVTLCDALERKKSIINMWLSTANMQLSTGIKRLVEGIETKVDRNLQLTQNLEGASMQQNQRLSQLPALFDISQSTFSAITGLSHEGSFSQQQQLASAANTESHVRLLMEQWKELSPTLHEFRDIVKQSPYLQQSIRQVAFKATGSFTQDSGNGAPENVRKNPCTCRAVTRATGSETLSFLHFRKVFRQYHYRICPKFRSSATSLEYLVKIVPPTWLLSQTITLGFCISFWNARSSWKISPLVIGGARLVDSAKSPAFQAIRNVGKLDRSGSMIQPVHVKELEQTLRDLLQSQKMSVYDEDHRGSTVLYAVMDLYIHRSIGTPSDPCADEFFGLIKFLLELGSDPNTHRLPDQISQGNTDNFAMSCQYVGGTLLDMFTLELLCIEYGQSEFLNDSPIRALIYENLLDSGAHFSRPLQEAGRGEETMRVFYGFFREMWLFQKVEEQREVCGLNDLMVSIIRQSEVDFRKAITKDSITEASMPNGLTAIHFAIRWPWALKELIDAGADIDGEDSLGRRPIHMATLCGEVRSVDILLEADCSLFVPDKTLSLLEWSLRGHGVPEQVSSRIIDALIDRHTRLFNLALSFSIDSSEPETRSNQRSFNEREAPKLLNRLTEFGCRVPSSLQISHCDNGVYDHKRLTDRLADKLWDGGFHHVDEQNPVNRLTPILLSWYAANLDMVSWFISKGASPFSQSPDKAHSGLHLYAAQVSKPDTYFATDRGKIPIRQDLSKQIMDVKNMWHDTCRCLCSPRGCTPISIAVKQWWGHFHSADYDKMLDFSRSLNEKFLYRPEDDPDHVQQLLGALVFEKLNLMHSCCQIGDRGQTETWWPRQLEGKRDYCSLGAEHHRSLTDCSSKMLRCGCDTAEKPVCAVFRDECENRR